METIQDVINTLQSDFNMSSHDGMDVESHIEYEEIPLHVCKYAISQMHARRNKGNPIDHPKGYFKSIVNKHKDMPEGAAKSSKPSRDKKNLMTDPGKYDFWFGDRTISEQTCERIMFGYNSDEKEDRLLAIDLMIECAPVLKEDEIEQAIRLADTKYTIGSWPLRLAMATRIMVERRGKVSAKTIKRVEKVTGVPVTEPTSMDTDDLPF